MTDINPTARDLPDTSRGQIAPPATAKPISVTSVAWNDKARRVRGVLDSVAGNYDVMNDLMSGGMHRLWKQFTLSRRPTCVPARRHWMWPAAPATSPPAWPGRWASEGLVVLTDINAAMLTHGRDRLINDGLVANIRCAQVNAEKIPFADNTFDVVTIAFGLRNVTDKPAASASMRRVLKPGGQLLVLEFSKPTPALRPIYDVYSFKVLPLLGKVVAKDEASYRYLAESIRMHPDQETLLENDEGRRPRRLPLSQPHGRHRRGPPRLSNTERRVDPCSSRRSKTC